ncbi:MAG TPA: TIGR03435 family protein [Bryobacteraceae bacterium]|nr:TIGR03435 family protein [Bryobacteraceae bacterium]
MRSVCIVAILLAASLGVVRSQTAATPAFAVVSVKQNTSTDSRRFGPQFSGGRFMATNYSLLSLISTAWNLPFQGPVLTGGPNWIRSDRYDIEARAEEGALPPDLSPQALAERRRSMLRELLTDRFHLDIRREEKELPVYAVVVAAGGPKLERSKIEEKDCPDDLTDYGVSCHSFAGGRGRGLHGQAVDISDLARYVENWTDRPVVDQTGLKGLYHIETTGWQEIAPGPPPSPGAKAEDGTDASDVPTIFEIFNRLGLKLESKKASVDMFRIEHVDRPSEN